jgi:hypothetical protein
VKSALVGKKDTGETPSCRFWPLMRLFLIAPLTVKIGKDS